MAAGKVTMGLVASALLLSACTSIPLHLEPQRPAMFIPATSTDIWQIQQSLTMYENNPSLTSCDRWQAAYNASTWPKGDSLDVLKQIDAKVRKRFDYRKETLDTWNAFDSVILGTTDSFDGDCDDLAATVSAIALCAGIPRSDIGFALVADSPDKPSADHMIGFYKGPQGNFWTFGDTFGGPRALSATKHDIRMWSYLSDPKTWYSPDAETDFHRRPGYSPYGSVIVKQAMDPRRGSKAATPAPAPTPPAPQPVALEPWKPVEIIQGSYVPPSAA
jgi:hypothetical protein